MNWPEAFIQQMSVQLGEDSNSFFKSLHTPTPVSIHLHPQKVLPFASPLEQVPWNPLGRYLPSRPVFTLDPFFHAGAYYVQEASSMFLAEAVRQTVDLNQDLKVLDLAAAPGGKSIVLASLLSEKSLLVANEVINSRYQILKQNIAKWGYPNVWTTHQDANGLAPAGPFFDLILVDAPCSGEGLFRREPEAAREWSPEQVRYCSARQRKILADTLALLKPEGVLIYSTCTYNAQENAENGQWLIKAFDLLPIKLELPEEWGISEMETGYQFYPHRVKGEGFFLSCFQKKGVAFSKKKKKPAKGNSPWKKLSKKDQAVLQPWVDPQKHTTAFLDEKRGELSIIPAALEEQVEFLGDKIRRIRIGTPLGVLKQNKLVPDPAWALSLHKAQHIPSIELDVGQALRFLKKDQLNEVNIPKGWQLMRFRGLGLGWVKGLGNRYNNYYPNSWRILMDVPEEYEWFWPR